MNTEIDRKIAVIFVADVVGYSKHMELDENGTLNNYSVCEEILNKLLKKYKGSVFNTAGDSVLAEFQSAVNAVECGVEFQNEIKKRNQSNETDIKLEFRIGINMGDVVNKGGNLIGDGVNIAARLEALAQPNGISISKSVYDFVVPKTKITFNDLGVQKVKQNEFHAFDILIDPSQKRSIKIRSKISKTIVSSVVVIAILLVGLISFQFYSNSEDVSGSTSEHKKVLLVLPFQNLANSTEHNFISESMLDLFVGGLSGYKDLKVLSKNTSLLVAKKNLQIKELIKSYNVKYVLRGSVTVFGKDMRTNIEIRDIKNDQILFSQLKNSKTDDLFNVQDELVLSVLSKFNLEEDKIRVSNDDIETIEELRLLQFAAKEREKWSREGYSDYEKALDELYKINPNGYAHNLSQAWKFHYKFRLGFCKPKNNQASKKERRATSTECFLKAIEFSTKAIDINPNKADAYLAKGYFLASLYIINRKGNRAEEWGGLKKAGEFAEKGFSLINMNSYQYGLAGEVFTLCNKFDQATASFAKLFELDDNPTNTFTSFYMQASFLKNNLAVVKKLAKKIIADRKNIDEIDNCKSPFCGNAGFAYLFLLYVSEQEKDFENQKKYLLDYQRLDNKYTKAMFTGRTNPANRIWPNEFKKIIEVMDNLGWHE